MVRQPVCVGPRQQQIARGRDYNVCGCSAVARPTRYLMLVFIIGCCYCQSCSDIQFCASCASVSGACNAVTGGNGGTGSCAQSLATLSFATKACLSVGVPCVVQASSGSSAPYFTCTSTNCTACAATPTFPTASCVGLQQCVASGVSLYQSCDVRDGQNGHSGSTFNSVYGAVLSGIVCLNSTSACFTTGQTPLSAGSAVNLSCTSSACSVCLDVPSLPTASCASLQPCAITTQQPSSACNVITGAQASGDEGVATGQVFGVTFSSTVCLDVSTACFTQSQMNNRALNTSCTQSGCSSCSDSPAMPSISCDSLQFCVQGQAYVNGVCNVRTGGQNGDGTTFSSVYGVTFASARCLNDSNYCVTSGQGLFAASANFACTASHCLQCTNAPSLPSTSCVELQFCVQAAQYVNAGSSCNVRTGVSVQFGDGVAATQMFGLTMPAVYCLNASVSCVTTAKDPFNILHNVSCTSSTCFRCSDAPSLPAVSCMGKQQCTKGAQYVGAGSSCNVRTGNSVQFGDGVTFSQLFGLTMPAVYCLNATQSCVTTATDLFGVLHNVSCTTSTCLQCSDTPSLPAVSCAGKQQCAQAEQYVSAGSACNVRTGAGLQFGDGSTLDSQFGVIFSTTLCLNASNDCLTTASSYGRQVNVSCTTDRCYDCSDAATMPTAACAPLPQCVAAAQYVNGNCNPVTGGGSSSGGGGYTVTNLFGVTFPSLLCLDQNSSLACYTSNAATPFGTLNLIACTTASCLVCDESLLPPSFDCPTVSIECLPCPSSAPSLAACDISSGVLNNTAAGVCLGVDGVAMCLGSDDCIVTSNTSASYQCNSGRCLICTVPTTAPTPTPTPAPTGSPTPHTFPTSSTTLANSLTLPLMQTNATVTFGSSNASLAADDNQTTPVVAQVSASTNNTGFNTTDIIIIAVVGIVCVIVVLVSIIFVKLRRRHRSASAPSSSESFVGECCHFVTLCFEYLSQMIFNHPKWRRQSEIHKRNSRLIQ
jgi:hypothetical protein